MPVDSGVGAIAGWPTMLDVKNQLPLWVCVGIEAVLAFIYFIVAIANAASLSGRGGNVLIHFLVTILLGKSEPSPFPARGGGGCLSWIALTAMDARVCVYAKRKGGTAMGLQSVSQCEISLRTQSNVSSFYLFAESVAGILLVALGFRGDNALLAQVCFPPPSPFARLSCVRRWPCNWGCA